MKKFATVVSLCLPLLVLAQTPPPPPSEPTGSSSLSNVHDQLGLQATQEAAWQKYALAVNAYVALHYQQRPVVASQDDAAPAQIRHLVDMYSNRLAALEDIETAAKALYTTLTPAQQKLANQTLLASIPVIGGGSSGPSSGEKGNKPEGRGHRGGGAGGPGGGMGGMGR